jgi:oligopeptide transport system ATP-binding protein
MSDERLLDINHLSVSFFIKAGEVKAVNDVSYTLNKGEVIGIVGESGSGKSVSAYSIIGLIDKPGRVIGGTITFDGKNMTDMPQEEIRMMRGKEIAMIFQDPMTSLNPVFTVGNQIRESLKLHFGMTKKQANERAIELLKLVGINEPERRLRQHPFEFSGGMRQRAMIAMALAGEPKLLIADEPTTALDVTIQAQIMELLEEIKGKVDMAIILITHDLGIVADLADKVIVMYGGRIVEEAPVKELFKNPQHPYTWGLIASLPRLDEECCRLIPIEGTTIDLLNVPPGCPFAPRCSKTMKICIEQMPPYFKVSEGHNSACWLLHEFSNDSLNPEVCSI